MTFLTTLPFSVAFLVAMVGALRPTGVVAVNRRSIGMLDIGVWRMTARRLLDVAPSLTWFARLWRSRIAFAVAALLFAVLLADLNAAHAGGVVLATTAAVPDLAEVRKAIEDGNRAFEEFKKTNDTRLKELAEKGVADPLLQQKLDKINEAIDKQSELNERFIAAEATANKLAKAGLVLGEGNKEREERLLQFNRTVRAHAASLGRSAPADFDMAGYDAYLAAEQKYLRGGETRLNDVEKRALSVGTSTEGGYLVTPDTTGRMVTRLFETSPMRQFSSVQVIATDALEGSSDRDEASFGWVGELGTRSETNTPQVPAPWRIPVHEAYASPKTSQKMLEDANIDVQGWLGKKVADRFGRGYNTAFVTGNGISKPRGFASYTTAATADASRAWGVFEHIASGSSGSFGTDPNGVNKLLDLIHAMKDGHAVRAAFYWNRTTLGKARQLTDASSNGKYVFIPSFQAGLPDTFLGYPSRKMQDMATYSTADSLAVAFGDMEETYQIVDRLGITVLVDPYTAKPNVIFYTRGRVGGDVVNFESLKFLKFGS